MAKLPHFFKSLPICFKFSGITLDDMRNYYAAFHKNLLIRILLKTIFVEKIAFCLKKHLLCNIFQKPIFINTILFHNIEPQSITRFYTTFQKILLVIIFYADEIKSTVSNIPSEVLRYLRYDILRQSKWINLIQGDIGSNGLLHF